MKEFFFYLIRRTQTVQGIRRRKRGSYSRQTSTPSKDGCFLPASLVGSYSIAGTSPRLILLFFFFNKKEASNVSKLKQIYLLQPSKWEIFHGVPLFLSLLHEWKRNHFRSFDSSIRFVCVVCIRKFLFLLLLLLIFFSCLHISRRLTILLRNYVTFSPGALSDFALSRFQRVEQF